MIFITQPRRAATGFLQGRPVSVCSLTARMTNEEHNSKNGKDRRTGKDRRKRERRTAEKATDVGVLSTRKVERRKQSRRTTDRKPDEEPRE
jgi:hypothetical protein